MVSITFVKGSCLDIAAPASAGLQQRRRAVTLPTAYREHHRARRRRSPPSSASLLGAGGGTWADYQQDGGFMSDFETGYEGASCWHTDTHADPAQMRDARAGQTALEDFKLRGEESTRCAPQPDWYAVAPADPAQTVVQPQPAASPVLAAAARQPANSVSFGASVGASVDTAGSSTGGGSSSSNGSCRSGSSGSTDEALLGLSDQEDWVFQSGCEGAACWQVDLSFEAEKAVQEAAAFAGAAYGEPQQEWGFAPSDSEGFAPFEAGILPASAATTQDYFLGDLMAGAAEDEQLRSRGSVLASLDGMVGNWEWFQPSHGSYSQDGAANGSEDVAAVAARESYAQVLSALEQLEAAAGMRHHKAQPAGAAAISSGEAGEGAK